MKGVLIGWLLGLATGCAVTFFAAIYQLGDVLRDNAKLPAPRSLLIVRTAAATCCGQPFWSTK